MITTKIYYIQTRRRNRRNSATNKVNIRHVNNIWIIMVRITLTLPFTNSYVIESYWYKNTQTDSRSNYYKRTLHNGSLNWARKTQTYLLRQFTEITRLHEKLHQLLCAVEGKSAVRLFVFSGILSPD